MKLYSLFFLLLFGCYANAQEATTIDYSRLPDKAYLQLDRNLYSTGDTIWAKAYVFHRNNIELSDNSYSLHIQILSQDGKDMGSYKMLIVDGMGYGQIPIYKSMKPGFYQIVAHTGHMKNFGMQFFCKKIIEIHEKSAESSIKTFFDKKYYHAGDTAKVTFLAYDEFQTPYSKKRFRYDLKYGGKTIDKGGLRCYEDGSVRIPMHISKGSKRQPPILYLSYFQNEDDEKAKILKITIPMVDDEFLIGFYPESGELVMGLNTRVAFKATDVYGQGMDVKGVLMADGEEILEVSSLQEGMGVFELIPTAKEYTFRVIKPLGIDSLYSLPKVAQSGYNLAYLKQDANSVYMKSSHSFDTTKIMSLWVSQYDQLQEAYSLSMPKDCMFTLSKSALPKGIVTLTLVDEHNIPVAERLIYAYSSSSELSLSCEKMLYNQRKKVKVKIALNHLDAKAQLSVAVVDSVLANSPWLEQDNIMSYAYLQTELRGKLPNLGACFEATPKAENYRNLLMMTHGWRRFNWIANQQELSAFKITDFDCVTGSVKRGKKPQVKAKMIAMVMGQSFAFTEFLTDNNGQFRIRPTYDSRNDQKVLFQANSQKGRKNVNITLQNTDTLLYGEVRANFKDELIVLDQKSNRYYKQENKQAEDVSFLSYETKLLKELVVYGERYDPDKAESFSGAITAFSARAMSGEDLVGGYSFANYVEQVSSRAKYDYSTNRIVVRSRGASSSFNASGNASDSEEDVDFYDNNEEGAEIYVNDMSWGKDVNALDFLTKEDIAEIVVLDPEGAFSTYGSGGEYGVILVRTNNLNINNQQNTINRNMAIFGRFIDSKEFYKQAFEEPTQSQDVVVDNRITLHWEPFVETDANGEATFEFYTDDISGVKQIVVQGIDDKGNLYYCTHDFNVEVIGY